MRNKNCKAIIAIKLKPSIVLIILVLGSNNYAFSQGMYLSKENGISASVLYGRYTSDNELGFGATYSLKGFLDLSLTRSTVLTKANISNFQNEYFLRMYIFKQHRFFFSSAFGYVYQQARTDLWKNVPFYITSKGLAFEGGLHLSSDTDTTRRVIISLFYRYLEPTTELQMPAVIAVYTTYARSFTFDMAMIRYVGKIGVIIGHRVVLDNDFRNPFYGMNFSLMIRH